MKYMGSKNRIAKHILPIMLAERTSGDQYWVEPFVGGANMIDKVTGNRIGADANKYVIALLIALRDGWVPPLYTEEEYLNIKRSLDPTQNSRFYPDHVVGYAATQLSFGSVWFSAFRRDSLGIRNYAQEACRNVAKQAPKLQGITFTHTLYETLQIPPNSIIYCDPPYENTTKYKNAGEFDHPQFWDWCRKQKSLGHTIFVSEYRAPADFTCVWEKSVSSSLRSSGSYKKAIEKLFTLK